MIAPKSYVQLKVEEALLVVGRRTDGAIRRTRILASAVQECSEIGYMAVTMGGVARRARVSTATLYREFRDKPSLLKDCMSYLIPFLTHAITREDTSEDPVKRVTNLLFNHGLTAGDPFMTWLYRVHAGTAETTLTTQLITLARSARDLTEAFWRMQLSRLEEQGHIRHQCQFTTINLLLGQIERRSMLARLLFGNEDQGSPSLESASKFAAEALFANLGTDAFHKSKWATRS